MKKAFSLIGQTIIFLAVFLAGTLWDPFHLKWFVTHPGPTSTRYFVPDGMLLMLALYVLLLALAAGRKRLRASCSITTLALVLAFTVGLLSGFGFATHELL